MKRVKLTESNFEVDHVTKTLVDNDYIFAGVRTLLGWALPCPVAFLLLGAGILLFGIGSNAFKNE